MICHLCMNILAWVPRNEIMARCFKFCDCYQDLACHGTVHVSSFLSLGNQLFYSYSQTVRFFWMAKNNDRGLHMKNYVVFLANFV